MNAKYSVKENGSVCNGLLLARAQIHGEMQIGPAAALGNGDAK